MGKVVAFARLTRPVFLAGGALVYALGAALAAAQGVEIEWHRYAAGQALVTAVQLTAQYANEYYDAPGDRADGRTWFSGGSGVLASGRLPAEVALSAARLTTAAATALLAPVALLDVRAAVVGAAALAGAWAYSAPPLRLVAGGAGEIAASLIVGALVPLTAVWVNGGDADAALTWTAAALVAAHFSMIVALSVPDVDADRASGKWTLAARLGPARTRVVHVAGLLAAFVAVTAGRWAGALPGDVTVAVLPAVATGALQVWAIDKADRAGLLTSAAVATFALLTGGLLVGMIAG